MSAPRTGMASRLLAVFVCLAGVTPPLFADVAVVTLADGRRLEGELVEQNEQRVVLRISGIDTPLSRDEIRSIDVQPSIEDEYRQRKAALEPGDLNGRYDLAFWLFQRERYDLAAREVEELLQLAPEAERVQTLAAAIQSRRTMADNQPATQGGRKPQDGPGQEPAAADGPPLLDQQQINLIKVWELPTDLSQTQARIRVPRQVLEQAFAEFGGVAVVPASEEARRQLLRASSQEQMAFLFALGAAEPEARVLYRGVEITGDPEAITNFRRAVYGNYIQRYFRRLFGSGQIPGFELVGSQPNTTAEVYTNFYILSQTIIGGHPMIDRQSPTNSLLLQWGLPREVALLPAPQVEGWRPFFAGPEDPAFERIAAWIESLYQDSSIDYGIDYPGKLRQDAPFAPGQGDAEQAPPQPVQPPAEAQ